MNEQYNAIVHYSKDAGRRRRAWQTCAPQCLSEYVVVSAAWYVERRNYIYWTTQVKGTRLVATLYIRLLTCYWRAVENVGY